MANGLNNGWGHGLDFALASTRWLRNRFDDVSGKPFPVDCALDNALEQDQGLTDRRVPYACGMKLRAEIRDDLRREIAQAVLA